MALRDLGHVQHYIVADSPGAAAATIEKIVRAIENLPSYPNLGRPGRVKGTRELVVVGTPFLIPYRIKDEKIEILAVIHGARRWPANFL